MQLSAEVSCMDYVIINVDEDYADPRPCEGEKLLDQDDEALSGEFRKKSRCVCPKDYSCCKVAICMILSLVFALELGDAVGYNALIDACPR